MFRLKNMLSRRRKILGLVDLSGFEINRRSRDSVKMLVMKSKTASQMFVQLKRLQAGENFVKYIAQHLEGNNTTLQTVVSPYQTTQPNRVVSNRYET
jgi:hypothetical protein